MLERRLAHPAGHHPRELADPFLARHATDATAGHLSVIGLGDDEVVVGVGGPASMIGFDVARTSNPSERFASASGIINQGGFLASLLLVVAIGLVLDWRTPGGGSSYSPSAFRWAMSTQYVIWTLGLVQVYRYRVRTRRVVDRDELEGITRPV